MFGDLLGGSTDVSYREFSDLGEEEKGMARDVFGRGKELSAGALARGNEVYGQNKDTLQKSATATGGLQSAIARGAGTDQGTYDRLGAPLLETIYGRNVKTPEQRQSEIDQAVGDVGGRFGRAVGQQTQQLARAGARFGLNIDPKQFASMAAARVGAENTARDAKVSELDSRERSAYDMVAGREALGLQKSQLAGQLGGQLTQQVGGMQDIGLAPYQAATQALNPATQITSGIVGGTLSQQPIVQEDSGLFGELAPLAMGAAGFGAANPALMTKWFGADGGMPPGYNNGGEVGGGFELFPGSGIMASFADGGEVEFEDGMQPALERADGALTRGDGSGGALQGPGTGISDDIPAQTDTGEPIRVANGEYIIPKDVVDILGEDFFDGLVKKLHTPAALQREQGGM